MMNILAVGGGSGGHVTPVVAVLAELAKHYPEAQVTFVCDASFAEQARGLMAHAALPVEVKVVSAGKFRRYAHIPIWRQLLMPQIVLANIADGGKVIKGIFQSLRILRQTRPAVVFAKGGFVCLPVGIAAHWRRIPLVVHDSDTRPGLTNSVLSRWASAIATGFPLDNYSYNPQISRYVGVPIAPEFHPLDAEEQAAAKRALGFDPDKPLVVATGGGLGAMSINNAMVAASERLTQQQIQVYHITGKAHFDEISAKLPADVTSYKAVAFVYERMAALLGAADVVVARGSATFLQELSGLGKAVIIVPARQLGDQQKNAAMYQKADAAMVMGDDEIGKEGALAEAIETLVNDPALRSRYAATLHEFARPHAARDVAQMIADAMGDKQAVREKW